VINSQAGMGGVDGKPDFQEYRYQIFITYTGKDALEEFHSSTIENEKFKGRIVDGEETETRENGASVKIEGKMTLDTQGLGKQQLVEMGPVITGVAIQWKANGESFAQIKSLQPGRSQG
jgi:hypothetical protein